MVEELELKTYLFISSYEFRISLFDIKNSKELYKQNIKIENNNEIIDLEILKNFLENNIFKIEKLIGKFIKNIFLIIESNKLHNINLSIKKKNYDKSIKRENLENLLKEAKDLFDETYKDHKIIHMVVNKYLINDIVHQSLDNIKNGDNLGIEIKFISFKDKEFAEIEKILKNFQIEISSYLCSKYIKNLFDNKNEFSQMVNLVQNGYNENEVILIAKNTKKMGFFEKFFQLFS